MKTLALAILAIPVLLMLSAFLTMVFTKSGISGKVTERDDRSLRKEVRKLQDDEDTRRIRKFGFVWVLPSALTILRLLNFKQFLLTCMKKPSIYRLNPRTSKKIVLFAIYEKENIRNDVKNALKELYELDCTIVLVNSRRLSEASRNELTQWTTAYIERPNYGRDFGSYKDGMLWIYKNLKPEVMDVERLLILNDSVFYTRANLRSFFTSLLNTQRPVYGATMNFQIIAHIGSFCLSLSSSIFQHKDFKKFWRKYRKTDLRAHTIKYGELELSKLLTRISPSDPALNVMFTGDVVIHLLMNDDELLKTVHEANRQSNRAGRAMRNNVRVERVRMDHLSDFYGSDETIVENDGSEDRFSFAATFEDGFEAFSHGVAGNRENLARTYKKSMIALIGNDFERESQIHRNATILPYLGCAIVKLDLEFRGIIDTYDRITICDALDPDEAEDLGRLLSSRPWGEYNFTGWRLSAFQFGHL